MSGEPGQTTSMHGGLEPLRGQLRDTVELVRRSGGGVVFERFPGALQEESRSDDPARSLVDAADDLAEALAQLEGPAGRVHPVRRDPGSP